MLGTFILISGIVLLVGGFVRNMFATYAPPHPHPAPGAPPAAHDESNAGFWIATVAMLIGLTMILSVSVKPKKLAEFQKWAGDDEVVVPNGGNPSGIPAAQVPGPPDPTKVVYDKAARILSYPSSLVPQGWEFGARAPNLGGGTSGTAPIAVPAGVVKMEVLFRKTGSSDLTGVVVVDTPL